MKKLICGILALVLVAVTVDFFRFPEWYLSTWKYQLERDIASGDEIAVAYYENTYLANGRILFE